MKAFADLKNLGKPFWIIAGLMLLCLVGVLDYLTGHELGFSLFYLVPIGLVGWFAGNKPGVFMAVAGASVWLAADIFSGAIYSNPGVYVWNTLIRLSFFLLTVFSIKTGKALEREQALAQTDYMTGVMNSRFFHTLAQRELDRSNRYGHPFTIAYIDIDNFKKINDNFGHAAGDRLLRNVARSMQTYLRATDLVARLGGDEFAILLPETGTDAAQSVMANMQLKLEQDMNKLNVSVTFSIGVLTFVQLPDSVDEAINLADRAMYSVKNAGKNDISYIVFDE